MWAGVGKSHHCECAEVLIRGGLHSSVPLRCVRVSVCVCCSKRLFIKAVKQERCVCVCASSVEAYSNQSVYSVQGTCVCVCERFNSRCVYMLLGKTSKCVSLFDWRATPWWSGLCSCRTTDPSLVWTPALTVVAVLGFVYRSVLRTMKYNLRHFLPHVITSCFTASLVQTQFNQDQSTRF